MVWCIKDNKVKQIHVLYFNKHIIHTIDFHTVFKIIFSYFPNCEIYFSEMNHQQKSLNSTEEYGMMCIKKLFIIFDGKNRREDIEDKITLLSKK